MFSSIRSVKFSVNLAGFDDMLPKVRNFRRYRHKIKENGFLMSNIKQLAEAAGVSVATASRAMSNPQRVSDATREKVLAAAKEIGYTPNRLGASLRTAKTGNIVVIIPDVSDTFNFGVIKSLERAASKLGYSVLLGDTQGLRERELAYGEMVRAKQADGVILFSHRLPFEEHIAPDKLPATVNSCEKIRDSNIPFVAIDNEQAGYDATRHLIELGHTKIAVITGDIATPSSVDRMRGYERALHGAGIPLFEEYIQHGAYNLNLGESCTENLLLLKQRPSAVFCFSDEIAIGCLHALRSHGFNVPADMSVIGFDDIPFARYFSPPLTTIAQPVTGIGEHCVELLVKILEEDAPDETEFILPHELIVRSSTAPCRV